MNFVRKRPWIWLVLLFLLPLIPWAIFIHLASKHPMHRTDKPAAHDAAEKESKK